MIFEGRVIDSESGAPLEGATVVFSEEGNPVTLVIVTENTGQFEARIHSFEPDTISISHVGHKPWTWPASEYQHTFELEKNYIPLPPVILPPGPPRTKKNNSALLILAVLLLIVIKDQN